MFEDFKRETCAIRISACYDKSGSSDLKMCCLLFCGVVIELWLFSVGIFCCDSGAIFEGGGWDQRVMGKGAGTV